MEDEQKQGIGIHWLGAWLRRAAAGIVALAAVGLAIWEGLENRRHNRLSVVPNVDAVRDFDMRVALSLLKRLVLPILMDLL